MPHGREFPPANGEVKKELVTDCDLLLKGRKLLPANFKRFLANMFVLMGSTGDGLETPESVDRSGGEGSHVLSLENRNGEVVVHVLPLTTEYSGVQVGEMVYRSPRANVYLADRFLFNSGGEDNHRFRSYLTDKTTVFDGNDILFQTAELNPEQLVVFARKFFAAWQRSQNPPAAVPAAPTTI